MNGALGQPKKLTGSVVDEELGELPSPPSEAFLWGRLPPRPRVAIVGSRRASPDGLLVARRVARELASEGICVVSGGASGVDRAAHEGALEVGGATLVVGPVWLDRAYPLENRALFHSIVGHNGGYLCVADQSAQPLRPYFHRRNAALVCLSESLLIGESGHTSGALNAAAAARGLGRPRFVLPWTPDLPGTLGAECELLLRGAIPYFRKRQILSLLDAQVFTSPAWVTAKALRQRSAVGPQEPAVGAVPRTRRESRTASAVGEPAPAGGGVGPEPSDPTGSSRGRVLSALKGGATCVEELCQATELAPAVVQHQVLLLTLEGLVGEMGGLLRLLRGASAD